MLIGRYRLYTCAGALYCFPYIQNKFQKLKLDLEEIYSQDPTLSSATKDDPRSNFTHANGHS